MDAKPRLTKQGLRDLNHYGPKPIKAASAAVESGAEETPEVSPPAVEQNVHAPLPVGA